MNKIEAKCLNQAKELTQTSTMANVYIGHSIDSLLKKADSMRSQNTEDCEKDFFKSILKELEEIKKQNDIAKDSHRLTSEWLNVLENQE